MSCRRYQGFVWFDFSMDLIDIALTLWRRALPIHTGRCVTEPTRQSHTKPQYCFWVQLYHETLYNLFDYLLYNLFWLLRLNSWCTLFYFVCLGGLMSRLNVIQHSFHDKRLHDKRQTALSFNLIQVHRNSVWIEEFLILNNIIYFMHVV